VGVSARIAFAAASTFRGTYPITLGLSARDILKGT
jgi:hypothetical protein